MTATALPWWLYGVLGDPEMAHPPGKWEGLHPEFARRLAAFCADHPGLSVLSGHRSSVEQRRLYDGFKAGIRGFNPANPPGLSNHEAIPDGDAMSVAADLTPESVFDSGNISDAQANEIGRRYGLHFPLRHQENEDHHCQPVEQLSAHWGGSLPALARWDL